jgi:hypothetical protein
MTPAFTQYIGRPLIVVLPLIRANFHGSVVVLRPGYYTDASVKPSRLKVFVDDQDVVTKIVNG